MHSPVKADRLYSRKWLEAERQLAIRGFTCTPSPGNPPVEPFEPIAPSTDTKTDDPFRTADPRPS